MSPLLIFLTVFILGLPIAYLFLKYVKLRYKYFKPKHKNDFFLLKDVFTPMLLDEDLDNHNVKQINKLTPILWVSFISYSIIMILLGRYVEL